MSGWVVALGTIVVALLGAGCATQNEVAVSAMIRTEMVRAETVLVEMTRIKVDLTEIVTP